MITNKGKELLARYLSGQSSSWAGAIEFGVGDTAAAATDDSLEFPFVRVPVDFIDYNPNTYVVTARAILPESVSGSFREVGIFSSENFPDGTAGHQLLLDYSGQDTVYAGTNDSVVSVNAKVGSLSTLLTAPGAGTAEVRAFLPGFDLNAYTGNDVINLAYHYNSTGGTPSVNMRFESTLTDYFSHSFTPSAGYNIESFTRQSMAQTGSPSWDTVNSVYIELDDQGELTLDGLMIEDTINSRTYGMIAREVLGTELVKPGGVEVNATFDITLGF